MYKKICALALISVCTCFLFTSCYSGESSPSPSGGLVATPIPSDHSGESSPSGVLLLTLTGSTKYQYDIVDAGAHTTIDETRKGETRTLRFRGRTYTGVYVESRRREIGSTAYDKYAVTGDESVIRFGLYQDGSLEHIRGSLSSEPLPADAGEEDVLRYLKEEFADEFDFGSFNQSECVFRLSDEERARDGVFGGCDVSFYNMQKGYRLPGVLGFGIDRNGIVTTIDYINRNTSVRSLPQIDEELVDRLIAEKLTWSFGYLPSYLIVFRGITEYKGKTYLQLGLQVEDKTGIYILISI